MPGNGRNPEADKALGQRIRQQRLAQGLTRAQAAPLAGVNPSTLEQWESGLARPGLVRLGNIVRGWAVPACSFSCGEDQVPVADVVLSQESVDRVRREGRPAAAELAQLLAAQLEPLIYQAATRIVDTSHGARPKRRRTRAEVLAGVREAKAMVVEARRLRVEANQPPIV